MVNVGKYTSPCRMPGVIVGFFWNQRPSNHPTAAFSRIQWGDIVARLTEGLGRLRTLTEVTMAAPEVGARGIFFQTAQVVRLDNMSFGGYKPYL